MVDSGVNDQRSPANSGPSRLWGVTDPAGSTITDPVTLSGFDRTTGYRLTSAGTVGDAYIWAPSVAATPGETITVIGQLRLSKATNYRFQVWAVDAADLATAIVAETATAAATANTVVRGRLTVTVPAGAAGIELLFHAPSLPANTTFDATAVRTRRGEWPSLLYADGATVGWEWVGTPGDGTSRYANRTTVIDLGSLTRDVLAPSLAYDVVLEAPPAREVAVREVSTLGICDLPVLTRSASPPAVAHDVTIGEPIVRDVLMPAIRRESTRAPEQPRRPELRVLAQNIVTRRWQHLDLPLHDLSIVRRLSGAQTIGGRLAPALPDLLAAGLAPFATRLVVEDDEGEVRGSAIVMPPFAADGDERSLEAVGMHGIAEQETFDGDYTTYGADPLAIVRMLWTHLLTKPGRGPLAVTVSTNTSKVRVGGYAPAASTGLSGPQVGSGTSVSSDEVPAYKLSWWEAPKIGTEIAELAREVPFDFVERERWNTTRTDVVDRIELGWPRLGRRRTDLRFAEGENIIDKIATRQRPGDLVTGVRVRGAGEGRLMVLGEATRPAGDQLPVVVDIQDSTVTSPTRAKSRAGGELRRRAIPLSIEKILVDARHPHAPIGSFAEGDDILVQVELDWAGVVALWHRIEGWTWTPGQEAVAIDLTPSQAYRYGTDD